MFAMTQSQQNQGSSLCRANDSASSHTRHGHRKVGFIDSWGQGWHLIVWHAV